MISFRPHHFLCALGFQGMGYSPAFIKNFTQIKKTLVQNDQVIIRVVKGQDSLCHACPHKKAQTCLQEKKIRELDARHSHILNLKEGQIMTWRMAKRHLTQYMSLDQFHKACKGCAWKALGVCEAALKTLHETHDPIEKANLLNLID